jgi:hypothetical protein
MRIDSSGNLLVGTTSATGKITSVAAAYSPSTSAWATSAALCTQGAFGGGLSFLDGSAGYTIYVQDAGGSFGIGQGVTSGGVATRLFINSSGNFGLGTVSPTALLDVNGNLAITGTGRRITGDMSNATLTDRLAFQTSTTNGSTSIMLIPNGTGPNSQILLRGSATLTDDAFGQIVLAGGIDFRLASGRAGTGTFLPITMYTSGSERLRIDTSGNVGIGTSAPAYRLNVQSAATAATVNRDIVLRTGDQTNFYRLSMVYNTTTASGAFPAQSGGLYWEIGGGFGVSGGLVIATNSANAGPVIFGTADTERMRIDSSGNIFAPFNTTTAKLVVGGDGTTTNLGAMINIKSPISSGASLNYAININDSNTNTAGGQNLIAFSHNSEDYSAGNVRASLGATIDGAGQGALVFRTGSAGGGTEYMRISSNGTVIMSAYGAGAATFSASGVISSVSDETWKIKDGVPANPEAMLQKLEAGYWFYNDEKAPIFGSDRQLGFYAQNVHEAIGAEAAPTPEEGKPWGYYDRSVLAITVMSLKNALNSIQEQQARIEQLTNRLNALEGK